MPEPVKLFFNERELVAMMLGLSTIIEDTKKSLSNQNLNWTPESRKDLRDILAAATSAAQKIEKHTGVKAGLPPFEKGDEHEVLTKES